MENKLYQKSKNRFREKSRQNAHNDFPSDELLTHTIKRMSEFAPVSS